MTELSSTAYQDSRLLDIPSVSAMTAVTLAVADMIGIGVFTSLGFQVAAIPSPFAVIMLWVVGGIAALAGALCYAELSAMFPRSGGEYNLLSRIFNPAVGFLAGWVSATVGFAAPIALAAMAFGSYFAGVVPGAPPLLLGLAVVWLVSLVHLSGVQLGAKFQNISTFIKLGLIVVLIIAGLAFGTPQDISFAPAATTSTYIGSAPFAIGLVYVLYSYSGWNAATYIASEIHDPQRNLPRSIIISLAHRRRALCRAERGLPLHDADVANGRPASRRAGRRQAHIRRGRRAARRRADLRRARLLDQRDDLDRAARDHGDRRGSAAACASFRASGRMASQRSRS